MAAFLSNMSAALPAALWAGRVLLLLAALGGSAGAFIAMQLFHHKTQHLKFIFGVPLIFFLQVALISYFFYKG